MRLDKLVDAHVGDILLRRARYRDAVQRVFRQERPPLRLGGSKGPGSARLHERAHLGATVADHGRCLLGLAFVHDGYRRRLVALQQHIERVRLVGNKPPLCGKRHDRRKARVARRDHEAAAIEVHHMVDGTPMAVTRRFGRLGVQRLECRAHSRRAALDPVSRCDLRLPGCDFYRLQ